MDDNNSSFKKGGHLVGILSGFFLTMKHQLADVEPN